MNDPTQGPEPIQPQPIQQQPPQVAPLPTAATTQATASTGLNPKVITGENNSAQFTCPSCLMNISVDGMPASRIDQDCPFCRKSMTVMSFPRLTREPPSKAQSMVAGGGDATCQFYPELKAEVVCDECGCFMSQKAAVDWGGKNLCMPCLHNLRENKVDTEFRAELKLWDNRALGFLAMLPITLFTAPVALFLLLRYRKQPRGWVPRSSFRWWLALVLSIFFMVAWIGLFVTLFAAIYTA